ncbi:metal-dependent transcriptional regulator [Methanocella arvoryzae]|uniref:Fe-dependent transcription repressor n=1 Tax=Methanocella arvoryzae (strain DSM 22066 / NBRC 105507 / MRE50) TaxID=351160 RepID=Q0W7Y9_METAR|nr:metal-dependent transcriptional regulator [Methanocella arvoryzae]CAJ35504.1 putative Fe-dependent transcription repressor [Methanocella arvoryzae MRE50]
MKDIDGYELSPKKNELLKYLLERDGVAKTTDIAGDFSVDPSTITKMIGELSVTGLIEHVPYRGVTLTDTGREYAGFLIRRHRILGLMLSHYGLTHEEACAEASRFESYVSKETIDRICASLGHPTMGLCGRIKHDTCCCCPNDDM